MDISCCKIIGVDSRTKCNTFLRAVHPPTKPGGSRALILPLGYFVCHYFGVYNMKRLALFAVVAVLTACSAAEKAPAADSAAAAAPAMEAAPAMAPMDSTKKH